MLLYSQRFLNYDKIMLKEGKNYPLALKHRISGGRGHLSNDESALFIKYLVESGSRQIVLSHLSKEKKFLFEYILDMCYLFLLESFDLRSFGVVTK